MSGFEEFLNKIDFKKAIKLYVSISILLLVLCALTIAFVTRDKLMMAYDYGRVSESFSHNGINNNVKTLLNKLSSDSGDIVNCIIVDKDNNIVFKVNTSLVEGNSKFILTPYEPNRRYLQDNLNKDMIYKVVRDENILFNTDYIQNHQQVLEDIDQDFFYESDLGNQKIDLMNYLVDRVTGNKIFVIRTATPIPYGETLLKVIGGIAAIIFAVYWIGLALWVYRDANRKHSNPALWGLLTLITNLVGLIVYSIYKQTIKVCNSCGAIQSRDNVFCTACGSQLNERCSSCGNIVEKHENYCSKCGNKLQ